MRSPDRHTEEFEVVNNVDLGIRSGKGYTKPLRLFEIQSHVVVVNPFRHPIDSDLG